MYVCICRAIREREVDAAVRAGARRPSDVTATPKTQSVMAGERAIRRRSPDPYTLSVSSLEAETARGTSEKINNTLQE